MFFFSCNLMNYLALTVPNPRSWFGVRPHIDQSSGYTVCWDSVDDDILLLQARADRGSAKTGSAVQSPPATRFAGVNVGVASTSDYAKSLVRRPRGKTSKAV